MANYLPSFVPNNSFPLGGSGFGMQSYSPYGMGIPPSLGSNIMGVNSQSFPWIASNSGFFGSRPPVDSFNTHPSLQSNILGGSNFPVSPFALNNPLNSPMSFGNAPIFIPSNLKPSYPGMGSPSTREVMAEYPDLQLIFGGNIGNTGSIDIAGEGLTQRIKEWILSPRANFFSSVTGQPITFIGMVQKLYASMLSNPSDIVLTANGRPTSMTIGRPTSSTVAAYFSSQANTMKPNDVLDKILLCISMAVQNAKLEIAQRNIDMKSQPGKIVAANLESIQTEMINLNKVKEEYSSLSDTTAALGKSFKETLDTVSKEAVKGITNANKPAGGGGGQGG